MKRSTSLPSRHWPQARDPSWPALQGPTPQQLEKDGKTLDPWRRPEHPRRPLSKEARHIEIAGSLLVGVGVVMLTLMGLVAFKII